MFPAQLRRRLAKVGGGWRLEVRGVRCSLRTAPTLLSKTRGRNRLGNMPFISCGGGQCDITTIQTFSRTVASPAQVAPRVCCTSAKHGKQNSGNPCPHQRARHMRPPKWTGPAIARWKGRHHSMGFSASCYRKRFVCSPPLGAHSTCAVDQCEARDFAGVGLVFIMVPSCRPTHSWGHSCHRS